MLGVGAAQAHSELGEELGDLPVTVDEAEEVGEQLGQVRLEQGGVDLGPSRQAGDVAAGEHLAERRRRYLAHGANAGWSANPRENRLRTRLDATAAAHRAADVAHSDDGVAAR